MKVITSGISQSAVEKPVSIIDGSRTVDCFLKDKLVGKRVYNQKGTLILETPMKDGLKHGREITWSDDGELLAIEPYVKGKVHGTARQYGRNGKVIGAYTMVHGTGFDVWWQENENNTVFISEIHSVRDGMPDGYQWWFASSKRDLWQERHWKRGKLHGIERVWNSKGRLRRGYPKFYIAGQAVSKQKYIKMISMDVTLPVFREKDDLPFRELPSEIDR